jgi:menaquinone-dependent protoporphyrinogen oxidase
MNVLVAYASKHGSTAEIAEVIARVLTEAGCAVELRRASMVGSMEEFDAVVIGSSIYIGQWHADAMRFIDEHERALQGTEVWLFSSGPIGEDPLPKEEPPVTEQLMERTGANEHRSFAGRLDRSSLGFGERLITTALRAPSGDFRDWDAIREWAAGISRQLESSKPIAQRTGE